MLQMQRAVNLVGFDVHLVALHERNIIRVDLSSPRSIGRLSSNYHLLTISF